MGHNNVLKKLLIIHPYDLFSYVNVHPTFSLLIAVVCAVCFRILSSVGCVGRHGLASRTKHTHTQHTLTLLSKLQIVDRVVRSADLNGRII